MNNERSAMAGDQDALASLEKKLHVIRDWTTAVVLGFIHGFFLYGGGGIGKSYTVLNQLRTRGVRYVLHNSRMTGKGLFLALRNCAGCYPRVRRHGTPDERRRRPRRIA